MDDLLRNACDRVFHHAAAPPPRRHGPRGYADYQSYKPWLRDEFLFRCSYCLWRERWEADGHHGFGVEHVEPQTAAVERRLDYDNLVYACNTCNSTRRDAPLPIDPCEEPTRRHLRFAADGTVKGTTKAGEDLIDLCRLNRPLLVTARRRILNLIAVLRASGQPEAVEALKDLLSFPSDLPDLGALRPPEGNARPGGVPACYFERRRRRELPDVY